MRTSSSDSVALTSSTETAVTTGFVAPGNDKIDLRFRFDNPGSDGSDMIFGGDGSDEIQGSKQF